MEELRNLIDATLRRLEKRMAQRNAMSRVNAALTMIDPAMLLPLPAVGLIAATSPKKSFKPASRMAFRSVSPIGPDGDVFFEFVDNDFMIHPWQVKDTSWLIPDKVTGDAAAGGVGRVGGFILGLRVLLGRYDESTCNPGPLSLFISGDPALQWGLMNSYVCSCDLRLKCKRPSARPGVRSSVFSSFSAVHYHLDALTEDLSVVEIPNDLAHRSELEIDFHFEESIPRRLLPHAPTVYANVAPVWNSRDCRYPGLTNVEQAVAEHNKLVHPLDASRLGGGWLPWDIVEVGASDDSNIRFSMHTFRGRDTRGGTSAGFHLSYVPPAGERERGEGTGDAKAALSVILTGEAREMLETYGKHLSISYRSTTGSRANGLPAGTEFQLIDTSAMPLMEHITGCLVVETWGGTNGIMDCLGGEDHGERYHALVTSREWRSIGDVCNVIDLFYGDELEIVDERDLLRTRSGGGVEPLYLRVQFKKPDRNWWERRVLLGSCQQFLNRYLAGTPAGDVILVDIRDYGGFHENAD